MEAAAVTAPANAEMPTGVRVVAVLTLVSSIAMILLFLALYFLNFIGPTTEGIGETPPVTAVNLPVFFMPFLALFSFFAAIALLMDVTSKRLWQVLIAYWAVLIAFFLWVGLVQFQEILFSLEWGLPAGVGCWLAFLIPYFYAVGCIVYFLTEKPKKYLHAVG